jgi:hypothetical protein
MCGFQKTESFPENCVPVRGKCDRVAENVRTVQKIVRSSQIRCARPWNYVQISKLWAFLEIVRASQNNVPAPRNFCERSCNILSLQKICYLELCAGSWKLYSRREKEFSSPRKMCVILRKLCARSWKFASGPENFLHVTGNCASVRGNRAFLRNLRTF